MQSDRIVFTGKIQFSLGFLDRNGDPVISLKLWQI